MTKTIDITIDPTGATKVQTKGFIGRTCKLASDFLEKALGLVTSDKSTTGTEENQSHQQNS